MLLLSGCDDISYTPKPSSTYTIKSFEVQAVVTDTHTEHWYSGYAHHYRMSVEVYCEELNLSKTFTDTASGMFINNKLFDLKKGDNVVVVAQSKMIDGVAQQTWLERIK
jgi:hypothetical protein